MMQLMLAMIAIGCIAGAIYLHENRTYATPFFSEIVFWAAVITTVILLLIIIFGHPDASGQFYG